MTRWQSTIARQQRHLPLPQRMSAPHRDGSAYAAAIARWEDDGGLIRPIPRDLDAPKERLTIRHYAGEM